MINHARCLLINAAPGRTGAPGEEYIDPTYRRRVLDGTLLTLRRALFGHAPDRVMLNVRARQLMTLLHASELEQYVKGLDPRITYDVERPDLLVGKFGIRVQSSDSLRLWLVGDLPNPDTTGICEHAWVVSVNGEEAQVTVTRRANPFVTTTTSYTTSGGVTQLIPLPGTDMKFRLEPGESTQWRIDAIAKPSDNLGRLEQQLIALGDPVLAPLFGVTDGRARTEPWTTFYRLWREHPELPYRLGGLLLAYIYRTGDMPTE